MAKFLGGRAGSVAERAEGNAREPYRHLYAITLAHTPLLWIRELDQELDHEEHHILLDPENHTAVDMTAYHDDPLTSAVPRAQVYGHSKTVRLNLLLAAALNGFPARGDWGCSAYYRCKSLEDSRFSTLSIKGFEQRELTGKEFEGVRQAMLVYSAVFRQAVAAAHGIFFKGVDESLMTSPLYDAPKEYALVLALRAGHLKEMARSLTEARRPLEDACLEARLIPSQVAYEFLA